MRRLIGGRTIVGLVAATAIAASCGKKDDADKTTSADDPTITSGSLALNYATAALSSSLKAPSASTNLVRQSVKMLGDEPEAQSTLVPDCSNKGAPWDRTTNQKMQSSAAAYAQTMLYCETNEGQSPGTILGAFSMSGQILCLVDALGNIEYTPDEKTYSDVTLIPTTECGFSAADVADMSEGFPATIKTQSYSTGDWQKSVHITIPVAEMEFKLYTIAKTDKVAIKFIESWDHDTRSDKADGIAAGTKGKRGNVISIDRVNGILRAETADTYWGRRARFYAKGVLNATTGKFGEIEDISGVFSDFYKTSNSNVSGEYASVKGTAAGGFKYNSANLNGTSMSSIQFTNATPACVPASGCAGNDGITFTGTPAELNFLTIGAAHDAFNSSRAAIQTWLENGGNPSFTEFTTDVTL